MYTVKSMKREPFRVNTNLMVFPFQLNALALLIIRHGINILRFRLVKLTFKATRC